LEKRKARLEVAAKVVDIKPEPAGRELCDASRDRLS
jgi:hypothetical protein